jgi:hypothetical protein
MGPSFLEIKCAPSQLIPIRTPTVALHSNRGALFGDGSFSGSFSGTDGISPNAKRPALSFLGKDSARYPEIRRSVLGQRLPLVACHAFAAPRVVVLTFPVRARTPQSRAGVPCASTDESRLVRTHFPLPSEMLADRPQSSVTATLPEPATPGRALERSGRRHWTTSRIRTRPPGRRAPDSAPYSATPPRGAAHPEGRNSSAPAKRDHLNDGWRSSRRHSGHARA